jgi:hypothetical protein
VRRFDKIRQVGEVLLGILVGKARFDIFRQGRLVVMVEYFTFYNVLYLTLPNVVLYNEGIGGDDMGRLVIENVSDELKNKFKVLAMMNGRTMRDLIIEHMECYIEEKMIGESKSNVVYGTAPKKERTVEQSDLDRQIENMPRKRNLFNR